MLHTLKEKKEWKTKVTKGKEKKSYFSFYYCMHLCPRQINIFFFFKTEYSLLWTENLSVLLTKSKHQWRCNQAWNRCAVQHTEIPYSRIRIVYTHTPTHHKKYFHFHIIADVPTRRLCSSMDQISCRRIADTNISWVKSEKKLYIIVSFSFKP